MIFGIHHLTTFIVGTFLVVILPGPNSLYVATTASRYGARAGFAAALGILVGDTLLMTLSASGAASLLAASPRIFWSIRVAGAAYLVWVGAGLIVAAHQHAKPRQSTTSESGRTAHAAALPPTLPDGTHHFSRALLICLLNPKAVLFFVSFFVQFVSPDYAHPWRAFALLGTIVLTFGSLYLSTLIFCGTRLAASLRQHRALTSALTAITGILFVLIGLYLGSPLSG